MRWCRMTEPPVFKENTMRCNLKSAALKMVVYPSVSCIYCNYIISVYIMHIHVISNSKGHVYFDVFFPESSRSPCCWRLAAIFVMKTTRIFSVPWLDMCFKDGKVREDITISDIIQSVVMSCWSSSLHSSSSRWYVHSACINARLGYRQHIANWNLPSRSTWNPICLDMPLLAFSNLKWCVLCVLLPVQVLYHVYIHKA